MTTNTETVESSGFYGLGIAPKILKILEELEFTTPTPIQLKSIPITIEGKDMVGIAQTGTGKTLAFGIPMIQRLAQHKGRGLVILPTRELAIQVDEHMKAIGQKLGLRTAILIGGEGIGKQIAALKKIPHIIIATPGRLIDHLQNKYVNLNDVKILVLDEADMMFDMGFAPQIEKILKVVPKERQTMLFSATMPPAIMKIVTKHMALPISIEVAPAGTASENVSQEMIIVRQENKLDELAKVLKEHSGSVLVFSRTKHNAKKLTIKINQLGHSAAEIHSNKSLGQRREALAGFKNGRYRVLVATDIAARGIDVKGIELVLNFDLPDDSENYVHRIGRTGRADKTGKAISFVLPSQLKDIKDIERLIKKAIPVTSNGQKFDTGISSGSGGRPQRRPSFSGSRISNREGNRLARAGINKNQDRRQHPAEFSKRDRRPYNDELISAFNPFKEEKKEFGKKPFGDKKEFGRGNKRFGKFGGQKRSGKPAHPAHPQNEKFLTDKQRFKRSMTSRTS